MSEPIVECREEINVIDIARKYAERVARVIDEQTLANVEDQLAGYGYVKVVRCRDCKWLLEDERYSEAACRFYCRTLPKKDYRDGYCSWAQRKEQV